MGTMADIPDSLSEEDATYVRSLLGSKGFDGVNETQAAFLEQAGLAGGNTLLCAETGNGKTFCAETVVKKALDNGKRVGYLVPSVQLTNGKYGELNDWIGDEYTLANATWGDNAGYQYADVIVATFDSYFEAAIRGVGSGLDVLVFDDFHELYSGFRGDTIEKCLTIAKQSGIQIFSTSATIGNPDEIARWLDGDLIISPAKREVPIKEIPVSKDASGLSYGEFIGDLIMDQREKGPFMVFNFQTSHAQARALDIKDRTSFAEPDTDYRSKVESAVDTSLTRTHEDLIECLENGVAFHYSDLENTVKNIVEDGVKSGEIKCISCTTTLAYGFDSPIQSVIVADLARFGEFVGKYEYIQWIGRAGREGDMDEAYAFPIHSGDDAAEYFEFGTPVEEKSLESIGSHFGPVPDSYPADDYTSNVDDVQTNLSWLLIELAANGWNTLDEITEFVSLSLYGFYNRDTGVQVGDAVVSPNNVDQKVGAVLSQLSEQDFIHYESDNHITTTALGDAVFEYDHATRMECTPLQLKGVVESLSRSHPISPEELIKEFATVFYQCDLGESLDDDNVLAQMLRNHGFEVEEPSVTAGVVTWLWCEGISVDRIEALLDIDASFLPSTAQSLAEALRAVGHLYMATSYEKPVWVDAFAKQVEDGVTVSDLHLTAQEGVARGRVLALEEQIRVAWQALDQDTLPDNEAPTIEKLAYQMQESSGDFQERIVEGADYISTKTAPRIVDAVADWIAGDYTLREVPPTAESGREFITFESDDVEIDDLLGRSDTTEDDETDDADSGGQDTSLDDFL
jgi:helicase